MTVVILPEPLREIFPYGDLRKGQYDMIIKIHEALKLRQHIIVEASNGIGKTIAVLTAALPIAMRLGLKIVYLSRTHSQLERVIDELNSIAKKDILISAVEVRARRDMCLNKYITKANVSAHDAIEICHMLRKTKRCKYFESWKREATRRVIFAKLTGNPLKSRDILRVGRIRGVCPYEVNKGLISMATVISAPYIYLVDSKIRETFFSVLGVSIDRIILIFDEAHNLPNIAIDSLSNSLSTITIKRALNEADMYNKSVSAKIIKKIDKFIRKMALETAGEKRLSQESLLDALDPIEDNIFFLEEQGESVKNSKLESDQIPISYIYGISKFLNVWYEADPEKYVFLLSTRRGKKDIIHKLEVVALDPLDVIKPLLNSYSTISLSGTLHSSYREVTGLSNYSNIYYTAPEPFSRDQYRIYVATDVTSRLSDRTPDNYRTIMSYILAVAKYTPHNVGVFFPSYDVLNDLIDLNITKEISRLGKQVFTESTELSSTENDLLIEEFKASADEGAVLLGVMGGRNSEGVDYPGKEMESVCIVGIPLARPTPRVEASIEYYTKKFGEKGKIYSYVVPAIYKAAQTAGRVIRSPDDRGLIVLIDKRYSWSYYKSLLPQWIRREQQYVTNVLSLESRIKQFYNSNNI